MHRHLIMTALAVCLPLSAQAQSLSNAIDQNAVIEVYTPDFFAQFQPNNALEMVERIPGFTLRTEDTERGFGEADTNFLVNGRRPSTKTLSADDVLSRLPTRTIRRIEIVDGNALDIPGLSGQVVNIVVRAVELSGQWRYAARFEEGTRPQWFEGELTLTGNRGDLDFNLTLQADPLILSEDSVEQFFDGDGALIEDRTEDVFLRNDQYGVALNLGWAPQTGTLAGHVANLNISTEYDNDNNGIGEVFTALSPTRTSGQSLALIGENEWQTEVGIDYAFPLTLGDIDGRLKLIGLLQRDSGDGEVVFIEALDGRTATRSIFAEDFKEGENIVRGEYAFKVEDRHDVQLSLEYAFNFLDTQTRFEDNFTAPLFDDVRVEEDRFDARLTDSWQINPKTNLQLSLGGEYSSLQVVTPRSEARNFLRPKGFAALSYKLSDLYTVRARAERRVGQLDFDTFVSSRNLSENIFTAGNAQIKPSQSWDLSVEFERTDEKLLSGRIAPFLELIDDPIDRVLIDNQLEAPGNLSRATRYGIEANATLLFDTLGVPGLRLEAQGSIGDSDIDDPLTGRSRQINFNQEYGYNLFARYDIPQTNFALFGRVNNDESSPFFRLDDIRTIDVKRPYLRAGIIHKDIFGMQLQIVGTNLLDNIVIQRRDRFQNADRRLGSLTRTEQFARQRGRRISFILSDTF
jgi:hypothetical protein